MNIIKWFLWRRWKLIKFISGMTKDQKSKLMLNLAATNMGGCIESSIIYSDFKRIFRVGDRK